MSRGHPLEVDCRCFLSFVFLGVGRRLDVWSFLRVTPFGSHDTLPLHHDAHELTRQHDLTDLTCQHEEDSKVMLCAVVTKE